VQNHLLLKELEELKNKDLKHFTPKLKNKRFNEEINSQLSENNFPL